MAVRLVLRDVELRHDPTGDGLLLRVGDDAGRVGLGEAVARPGFSAPLATLFAAGARLAKDLEGRSFTAIDGLEDLSSGLRSADGAALPSPLRFAVETALLDLLGQASGRTIAALLFRRADPSTSPKAQPCWGPIERNALIHSNADAADIAALRRQGFRTVKIKARGPWPSCLDQLRALATMLGEAPPIKVRIDCNATIPKTDAPAILRGLATLAPEYVEEPVAGLVAGEWSELARHGVRLAVDESATGETSWREHLELGAASVAVIKPAFIGGIFAGLRRVQEARARDLEVVITSALEGAIGTAAAAHFAFAIGATTASGITARPGSLAPPWLAAEMPVIDVPTAPGLGVAEHDRDRDHDHDHDRDRDPKQSSGAA